jgi:uncharacterized protein (DUF58 family)
LLAGEMIATLLLLLALSVAIREAPLFLLCLALLLAALLSWLWERYALELVEYKRHLARSRVAFGEDVELEIELVNRKLLPLSWLEVEDELPAELGLLHGRVQPSHKAGRAVLAGLMAMRPYERVRRRYVLKGSARGEHLLGPVRLRSGDLFGFALCDRTLEAQDSLVVYPRVVPLAELGLPARNPVGDLRAQSWIFDDPSRVAGAREYRAGDSLRRVHWPATARSGRLQTRLYEATTGHKLAVFLNVAASEDLSSAYSYDPEVLEFSIMAAASIAAWGLEQGYQVGMYTNGLHRGERGTVVVQPGRSNGHLEAILLALGRLQPVVGERFEDLLAREARELPFGTTVIVVSPSFPESMLASLRLLRASHGVVGIETGRQSGGSFPAWLSVRRAGPPEDWRAVDSLPIGANS